MHSRIYALRIVDETITPEYEKLDENIDYDLVSGFVDYVRDSDAEEDIKWLMGATKLFSKEERQGEIYLTLTLKKVNEFLNKEYGKFLSLATKLKRADFKCPYSSERYDLKLALEGDNFGFWFCLLSGDDRIENNGFDNETSFLRYCYFYMERKNLKKLEFRFEGSLDYHA